MRTFWHSSEAEPRLEVIVGWRGVMLQSGITPFGNFHSRYATGADSQKRSRVPALSCSSIIIDNRHSTEIRSGPVSISAGGRGTGRRRGLVRVWQTEPVLI